MSTEVKDQQLFDSISESYARKDTYAPSAMARKFQIDVVLKKLHKQHPNKKFKHILEIGCGHGANSQYFNGEYSEYLGIDYSKELINIATKRYGNDHTKFTTMNLKDFNNYDNYDLIIGVGILHHVTDLPGVLKELKRKSKPNTVFAFLEPQNGNPFIQLLRAIRKITDKNYSDDQVFFSRKQLHDHFEQAGFKINELFHYGYFSTPMAQVILKPKFLFKPITTISIGIDKLIHGLFNSRMAWNILVIAQ